MNYWVWKNLSQLTVCQGQGITVPWSPTVSLWPLPAFPSHCVWLSPSPMYPARSIFLHFILLPKLISCGLQSKSINTYLLPRPTLSPPFWSSIFLPLSLFSDLAHTYPVTRVFPAQIHTHVTCGKSHKERGGAVWLYGTLWLQPIHPTVILQMCWVPSLFTTMCMSLQWLPNNWSLTWCYYVLYVYLFTVFPDPMHSASTLDI